MASTLWRTVIACELALALLLAFAVSTPAGLQPWSIAPIALGILLLFQYGIALSSLLASRVMARDPQSVLRVSSFGRTTILEGACFGFAQLAMSADPWFGGSQPARSASAGLAFTQPILLVHGLACNRGIWRWLTRRLRSAGFANVHAVNMEPLSGDLDELARDVERELLTMHQAYNGARVTIIAHSMGGLVARAALRTLGAKVIKRIITLATPHHGSAIARLLSWTDARQMYPGSSWLAALNDSQEGRCEVPLTSIYSLEDNLVAPEHSPIMQGAKSLEVRGLGHFGLITSRRSLDCVMHTLTEEDR
jgi:predicted alpha/beta hydrolase family esterase